MKCKPKLRHYISFFVMISKKVKTIVEIQRKEAGKDGIVRGKKCKKSI